MHKAPHSWAGCKDKERRLHRAAETRCHSREPTGRRQPSPSRTGLPASRAHRQMALKRLGLPGKGQGPPSVGVEARLHGCRRAW